MAQPFSMRYPLVEGQGNWGSPDDPKSFAAMRYTEAQADAVRAVAALRAGAGHGRLGPELRRHAARSRSCCRRGCRTCCSTAPRASPSAWPPTSRRTTCARSSAPASSCSTIPRPTIAQLTKHVKGPDFPTEAEIITPAAEIREMYKTGNGSHPPCARSGRCEDGDIVITALPFQVSGSKVQQQIAAQMQAKKLPMVEDLRDESDHENPTRLVIVPRSNRVDLDEADGAPLRHDRPRAHLPREHEHDRPRRPAAAVHAARAARPSGCEFRIETVRRRLQHPLRPGQLARLHILDGYLVAYLNIDEVIRIIRTRGRAEAGADGALQALATLQAEAILELKLRYLAKLEEMEIRGEQDELQTERDALEKILGSKARLRQQGARRAERDAEEFGDAPPLADRRARGGQGAGRDGADPDRAGHRRALREGVGARRQGARSRSRASCSSTRRATPSCTRRRGAATSSAVFLDSTGRTYSLPAHELPSAQRPGRAARPATSRRRPAPRSSA